MTCSKGRRDRESNAVRLALQPRVPGPRRHGPGLDNLFKRTSIFIFIGNIRICIFIHEEDHLLTNVSKTKEVIIDFRTRERDPHLPLTINGDVVEIVESFKYLGVHIHEKLRWEEHTTAVVTKAQQRLYGLRRLKKFGLSPHTTRAFYRGTIESLLTGSFASWYGSCTVKDHTALRRVVRSAERITECTLPSLEELYDQRCLRKSMRIMKDPTHPHNSFFRLAPSGKRYHCTKASTERLKKCFIPRTIRLLNKSMK